MRSARDRRHVVHAPAAVVHVGEHEHGDVRGQGRGNFMRLDQLERQALGARQAVGDVEVGGEVAALRDDEFALRRVGLGQRQCGAEHLVQVHRGRVAHQQLAGAGAYQRGDLVADAAAQRHPAGGVPAADELAPPFVDHHLLHASRRGAGQHAQGIAVEVDHARGQLELPAQRCQWVGAVERFAVRSGGHVSSLRMARTGEASALVSFRGRAMSS